ncbi:hypothetical protein GGI42DRAFT_172676 [Trichoderma sp. SZMC 28013]
MRWTWTARNTRGFRASSCSRAAPGLPSGPSSPAPDGQSQAAAGWGAPRGQPGQSAAVSAMLLVLIASCSLASPPASIDFESPRISLFCPRAAPFLPLPFCLSRRSASAAFLRCLVRLSFDAKSGSPAVLARIASRCAPQNPVPARKPPCGLDGPRFQTPGSRFRAPRPRGCRNPLALCLLGCQSLQSSSRSSDQMPANLVA